MGESTSEIPIIPASECSSDLEISAWCVGPMIAEAPESVMSEEDIQRVADILSKKSLRQIGREKLKKRKQATEV